MLRDKNGWRVQWTADGKRRSRNFTDRKEAARFEAALELGIADVGKDWAQVWTFRTLAERWCREHCRVELAKSLWLKYERMIAMHIVPAFGDVDVTQLKRFHLMELKVTLSGKDRHKKSGKLSAKTVNNILSLAKGIMTWGVAMELVPTNAFASVKLMKLPKKKFKFWQPSESETFLAHAWKVDPDFAAIVAVALHTGLRLGELVGLQKRHLKFDRRRIEVEISHSLNMGEDGDTKNGEIEEVPMNAEVLRILEPKRFLVGDETPVFDRAVFGWSSKPCRYLGRLAKQAGVPVIRFHDLRHTFASQMAMAGVDLMRLMKLMRHKSYQMTLRYAHLHPSALDGATEVLCTPSARKRAVNELV